MRDLALIGLGALLGSFATHVLRNVYHVVRVRTRPAADVDLTFLSRGDDNQRAAG